MTRSHAMIDLSRLRPVIEPHVQLTALPSDVRVVFAGQDAQFSDALRRIYRLPLPQPEILVSRGDRTIDISVGPTDEADGVAIHLTYPKREPGSMQVEAVLLFARTQTRESDPPDWAGHANRLVPAFEQFIFRRVLPAEHTT